MLYICSSDMMMYTVFLLFVQPSSLVQATQYTLPDLAACFSDFILMINYVLTLPQQAVREKYKTAKWVW